MAHPIGINHQFSQLMAEFDQEKQQAYERIKSLANETEAISKFLSPQAHASEIRSFQLLLDAEQIAVDDLQKLSQVTSRFLGSINRDINLRQKVLNRGYEALSLGGHSSFQYTTSFENTLRELNALAIPERQSSAESVAEELSSSQLAVHDLEEIFKKPASPIPRPEGPTLESQQANDNAYFDVETKFE